MLFQIYRLLRNSAFHNPYDKAGYLSRGISGIGGVGPLDSHDTMNQYQTLAYMQMILLKSEWIKRETIPFLP